MCQLRHAAAKGKAQKDVPDYFAWRAVCVCLISTSSLPFSSRTDTRRGISIWFVVKDDGPNDASHAVAFWPKYWRKEVYIRGKTIRSYLNN